jgi:hypothetical protein
MVGIMKSTSSDFANGPWGYYRFDQSLSFYVVGSSNQSYGSIDGAATNSHYGASIAFNGVTLGFALDSAAGTLAVYRDGAFYDTIVTGLVCTFYPFYALSGGEMWFNFGQNGWWFTPPNGFISID